MMYGLDGQLVAITNTRWKIFKSILGVFELLNNCQSIPAGSGMQRMLEAAKIVPKVGQCSYLVLLRFRRDDIPAKVFSKIEQAVAYADFCRELVDDESDQLNAEVEAEKIIRKYGYQYWGRNLNRDDDSLQCFVSAAIFEINAIENTCELIINSKAD